MKEYIKGRRLAIQANLDAEILAGNRAKEQCERTALAEITAIENAIAKGEIRQCSNSDRTAVLDKVLAEISAKYAEKTGFALNDTSLLAEVLRKYFS